jgi:hypothetical protein
MQIMTTQRFPSRREDGSAEVAAVFREPLEESRRAIDQAMAEWHRTLEGIDPSADLAGEPQIASSNEGFRIVFHIRPASRMGRDWAVALVDSVSNHLGPRSFVGFFDAVAGRMHVAGEDPFRSAD